MYVARAKENLELQKRLVRLGYPGEIDEELLETEELKELLSYPLKIFVSTWERAKAEKRDDILEIIVNRMLHDHQSNWIMIRYAEDKNWDAFIHGLSNGYDANGHALFEACWENGTEWTDKLLENGFDINQDAGKILNRAVEHRNLAFTKYLVEHGADVMATESYSATVLEKSLGSEGHWGNKGPANEELSVYLLEQGADPFRCLRSLFYRGGRIRQKTIDIIIDSGKINCVDSEGHLPLYYVVSNFNPPDDGTVEYLLSKGACADASGICDDLLFCYAFENYYKYPHVWKALIAAGANVNESLALCSPLRRALMWKAPVQYFEELLDAGANVNELLQPIIRISDSTYWSKPKPLPKTPLDVAESEGLDEIAALFRRHGALTYAEIVQGRA